MIKFFKNFMKEEDGLGTVEIIIIIAVLVGVALLFKDQIMGFVEDIMKTVFDSDKASDEVDPYK